LASKHIDIITSQNVVITYDLADFGNRFLSNIIDLGLIYLFNYLRQILVLAGIGEFFMVENIMLIWIYHLTIITFFKGRTVGMRALGLRIMKPMGGEVAFSDLFLRWIVRPLDITFTVGALGSFLMLGSEKRQRLGDMLAGTVVVRSKQSVHFSLADILSFHNKNTNSPIKYPMVRHFQETDMLFIKNLLQNQAGYSSRVHYEAIIDCALHMGKILQLESQPADNKAFLQQIVNDYIVLTR